MTYITDIDEAAADLEAFIQKHKSTLQQSGVLGYAEDMLSDLDFTREQEVEGLVSDGTITPRPGYAPLDANQLGLKTGRAA